MTGRAARQERASRPPPIAQVSACQALERGVFEAFSGSCGLVGCVPSARGTRPEPIDPIRSDRAADQSAAWSRDYKRIAFVSDRDGPKNIYVMEVDGSNVERLTIAPGGEISPTWSSDGQSIAYSAAVDQATTIGISPAFAQPGSAVLYPAPIGEYTFSPAWTR